jgi:AraC family transcriptional regulator
MTDFTPSVLQSVHVAAGRVELVEWHWPDMIDFDLREEHLMIEMSLPPMAADCSACLPELDPEKRCFMGTLFVRWPGVLVSGRSEGGHIRVIRCEFSPERAQTLTALRPEPSLEFLQAILSIRSDTLRSLMRLLHRELINPVDRSVRAMSALLDVIAIEFARVIAATVDASATGRLAAWQFRKIRERLAQGGASPKVVELAALCGISPRHLHRQFVALTGKTVADYIESARIEDAKRLLGSRERPIKAIALACGFVHANSFARAFRRSTGVSPQSYRQRASLPAASEYPLPPNAS